MPITSEELLALLSIHQACTTPQLQDEVTEKKATNVSNDWARIESLLPQQRNCVVRGMASASGALEKYIDGGIKENSSLDASISTLQKLEITVMDLRDAIATYSSSIPSFVQTLTNSCCNTDSCRYDLSGEWSTSTMSKIGYTLATQLISQLKWDAGFMDAILKFLDEDLYNTSADQKGLNDLRIYANSISAMLRIDKSFWKMVERQALDDLAVMQGEAAADSPAHFESLIDHLVMHQDQDENDDGKNHSRQVTSLHERIVSKASVEEAVQVFVTEIKQQQSIPAITSILLIGEEGCGKSFLLDTIQQRVRECQTGRIATPPIKVVRPTQQDLSGNTVGSSEDRWVALFSYAESEIKNGKRILMMFDDIDILISLNESLRGGVSSTHFQVGKRCKALFLSIIDSLQDSLSSETSGHLMLICTARARCEEITGRFDRVFTMSQMDEKQRQQMIATCLSSGTRIDESEASFSDKNTNRALSLAVKHSSGRTAYELSQCCRDVILSEIVQPQYKHGGIHCTLLGRLRRLDKMMQTKAPQSLRGGSLDGVVDMIVLTPEELIPRLDINDTGEIKLPLLGADVRQAYDSLMNVVITPLCRSEKIMNLLYGASSNNHDSKSIRVGALLAGGPGVGKTSLAYHCASIAAHLSQMTLLDVSCTSLIHKEIGGSERAVHRLFEAVRAAAPCILLLDGIENVAPRRGNDCTTEGTMDRVLSTFLTEMDGIGNELAGNVGVIGITYKPELIDPSLLRPGRLEKTIRLGSPDFGARKELISRNIDCLEFDFSSAGYFEPKSREDISHYVAMESAGMSAVETIAICKEASMVCLREVGFDVNDSSLPLLKHNHFKAAISIMKGKEAA